MVYAPFWGGFATVPQNYTTTKNANGKGVSCLDGNIVIALETTERDNAFIKRRKKKVLKNYSPTKSKTIAAANCLAVCLLARGSSHECKKMLSSYWSNSPYDKNRPERWEATDLAIMLLSLLEEREGNIEESNKLEEIIVKQNPLAYQFPGIQYHEGMVAAFEEEDVDYFVELCESALERCELLTEFYLNSTFAFRVGRKIYPGADEYSVDSYTRFSEHILNLFLSDVG